MCYQYGSVEHFTAVCPMCKVFKPSAAKCPHKKDICKNHAQDIVYLKNAEVQTFNGCGYCKWVKANPTKVSTHQNPGWAGCCRPPRENERVPPADWPAVAVVHNIPVPSEIRTVLESIAGTPRPATSSLTKAVTSPDRRTSPARPSGSPRAQPLAIPPKSRSPKEAAAQLAAPRKDRERDSPPTAESGVRRSVDGSSSSPSPLRRHVELENSIGRTSDRRSSVSRVPKANPDTGSGKGGHDPASGSPPSLRRRASNADARDREKVAAGVGDRRAPDRNNTIGPGTSQASAGARVPKRSSLDIDFSGLAVSNSALSPLSPGTASSSDGGSSISGSGSSDGTVTSDGGFTDYLSDESEAELQRQAEARAALLAQAQVEDLEFKAARKQLAHVDLRPPKSWNPGVSRGQQQAVEVGYGRSR